MIVFSRESLTDALWSEAMPLLAKHWAEIAHYPDIPLEPDVALYQAIEANGALRVFTARRDEALVGYALFFVRPNGHYKSSLQASQDVLYIDPAIRGGSAVPRFLLFCDAELKADGVQVACHHLKVAHNHERLMRSLGYEPVDIIWTKRLDGVAS